MQNTTANQEQIQRLEDTANYLEALDEIALRIKEGRFERAAVLTDMLSRDLYGKTWKPSN